MKNESLPQWTQVAAFNTLVEADLLRTLLEDHGIEVFIDSSHISNILPHATQAIGVRVSVRTSDLEAAREVLNATPKQEAPRSEPPTPALKTFSDDRIKKGTNAALFGTFFLPIVSNLYSLFLYFQALRADPSAWVRNRTKITLGLLANAIGLSLLWIIFQALQIDRTSPSWDFESHAPQQTLPTQ